jgi:hypothetical protein
MITHPSTRLSHPYTIYILPSERSRHQVSHTLCAPFKFKQVHIREGEDFLHGPALEAARDSLLRDLATTPLPLPLAPAPDDGAFVWKPWLLGATTGGGRREDGDDDDEIAPSSWGGRRRKQEKHQLLLSYDDKRHAFMVNGRKADPEDMTPFVRAPPEPVTAPLTPPLKEVKDPVPERADNPRLSPTITDGAGWAVGPRTSQTPLSLHIA